jgi:molybdenum cofactor cytidylyltransferase
VDWKSSGIIILAAGLSRRFGHRDKLTAPLGGKPLAAHVAGTVAAMPASVRLAVIRPDDAALAKCFAQYGVETLVNPRPEDGQGRSIAIGVEAGRQAGCESVLIMLADMPFVRPAHLNTLMAAATDADAAIASDGTNAMPPVLFSARLFGDLVALTGDSGAKGLLERARSVVRVKLPPAVLADIDTAEQLRLADDLPDGEH